MNRRTAASLAVVASLVVFGGAHAGAQADDGPPAARIGAAAPELELKDLTGVTHRLSTHRGKHVVLEWIAPDCPYVAKHHAVHPTVPGLVQKFRERDVVWLAIASGAAAADPAALSARVEAWHLDYPVLLDPDGRVATAYKAHATPHVFVIDPQGLLRYSGAIDDDWSHDRLGKTNYLDLALSTLLSGRRLERTVTVPYGCPIR